MTAPVPRLCPSVPKNIHKNIYCQDWQVFMDDQPKGSVDLILTDPPYAISRETGFSSVKKGVPRFAVSMDFGEWDHQKIDLETFAHACYHALRMGGTAIIWYDVWKITDVETALRNAGFKMLRLIIWQKTNPVPLNQSATYLSNSREVAVVGVKVASRLSTDVMITECMKRRFRVTGGRNSTPRKSRLIYSQNWF